MSFLVGLQGEFFNRFCSGTIVKQNDVYDEDDAEFFVFTAKHCVDEDRDGVADSRIKIQTYDNKFFIAELTKAGELNSDGSTRGDWAVYKITANADDMYVGQTKVADGIGDKFAHEVGFRDETRNYVRLVGYGALPIMSDADIATFKQKYIIICHYWR